MLDDRVFDLSGSVTLPSTRFLLKLGALRASTRPLIDLASASVLRWADFEDSSGSNAIG